MLLLIAGLAATIAGGPVYGAAPQASTAPSLEDSQADANRMTGSRRVPAKVIPVPADLDPVDAALAGSPYGPFWRLDPSDSPAWRDARQRSASAILPTLATIRARLGVSITPTSVGGVRAYVLTPTRIPEAHRNQLIFHLHGGGYVLGAGESGTGEAALMAAIGGYKVLSVDYRLPPDSPYPAAVDDAVAAWRAIVKTIDSRRIAVEGTSAGGGLTLALMLRIKAEKLPFPGAIAPGSPWSDMTRTGDSYETNEWVDSVLVRYDGYLSSAARLYAGGHDLREPGLSPINGDFRGLPPAILSTGTRDLFLSNTVRAHRKLRQAGVDAQLNVYEGLSHAQYAFDPDAPVTGEAFGEITRFFDAHLAR